jgi:pYEATS domain-containing protein involved in immunity
MQPPQLDVRLRYDLRDPDRPDAGKVLYREVEERRLYRVFLFLEGEGLPFVESVVYRLHPTFPHPEETVTRSPANPRCKLEIWTWGVFQATALIRDKRGGAAEVSTWLGWDRLLPPEAELQRV